jgi:hypothetical protein
MNQNKGIGAYQNRPGYFMGGMIGGAILGALVNKIQGKDWKRGALFGGITGGLGSGFLGSKMGEAAIAGMKPGFMQTMLQGVNPALAGTIGGVGAAYMAGDPAYDKKKMEEAMFAEEEERKRKNEGMYPDWYKNFFPGFFNKGGMIDERPGYYNGGGAFSDVPMEESGPTQDPIPLQIPMGQEGSFESEMEDLSGMDLAGLSDEERGELQSLMMLRLMIPKDDPKYQQNEIRIQELLGRMSAADGGLMRLHAKDGLWANIHAKRKRIESGSGEKMRSPGSKGAPTNKALRESQATGGYMERPGYANAGEVLPVRKTPIHPTIPLPSRSFTLQDWVDSFANEEEAYEAYKKYQKMLTEGFRDKGHPMGSKRAQGGIMGYYGGGMSDMDLTNGGASFGPGSGTSDDIPAMLSDGEFVVTANAVKNLGGGNRMLGAKKMYQMMNQLDPNSQTPAEMDTTGIA